jgi:hypothetical protein
MQRLTSIAAVTGLLALAAAPASGQTPQMLECPVTVAHGCNAEKCQNIGQIPTFRIDVAGKKVCYAMGGSCSNWENAEIFESKGGTMTIAVGSQRVMLTVDDKLKLKGARISGLGVAAFFSDCKGG